MSLVYEIFREFLENARQVGSEWWRNRTTFKICMREKLQKLKGDFE